MQVIAVRPYTPAALKVFKSACAPAPAELSEPAIVSTTGGEKSVHSAIRTTLRRKPGPGRHLNFAIRVIGWRVVNPFPEYSKLSAQANELAGLRVTVDEVN